jgi:excisionase family DNA binding protein
VQISNTTEGVCKRVLDCSGRVPILLCSVRICLRTGPRKTNARRRRSKSAKFHFGQYWGALAVQVTRTSGGVSVVSEFKTISEFGTVRQEEWLTPMEVASLLGVTTKTVARWARAGRLGAVTTLGGHRRYRRSEILIHLRSTFSVGPPR